MSDDRSRSCLRRGLTLVEVCLVLALLVVISAFAAPLMEGSFSRAGLQSGAELVRGAWARARLAAMDSGQTHVFRFEPRASRFQIITLDQLGMPGSETIAPEDPSAEHEAADMLRLPGSRLPDGVIFAGGNISDSSQVLALLGTAAQSAWSAPILFHPDGTTTDASVVLSNASQQTVRVTLRGLTGIANTSDVGREVVAP
ncbi:MAG TPA: prepilin-type N-terminal cleavage/methylation domain-containing protein [Lacipirellulaceae bacterium]|jgi:prepilin-type N-terminal cleavage/methylation domain-containing protein|nr:prepilin-type N-terminal cleavage/methylation domain-containing protein [Lacipirellulaceae bacterium]